jgi:DNA-binding LacI/PurR family transcriptional regulator
LRRAARAGATRASRRPSIKDIARLARVSHPTVSRALQNSPLVNAETAAKIRKIAEDAGYRASAVARGLVTRRTRTIGLVVTTVADPFASEVACGIEQAANDHGYAVFLANSHADPERERKVVQELAERRVDGIIVTSSRVGALYLPLLKELNVPIVLVNDQYPGRVCALGDDREPGWNAGGNGAPDRFGTPADCVSGRPRAAINRMRSGWRATSRRWRGGDRV